jgi:hypothetical protein
VETKTRKLANEVELPSGVRVVVRKQSSSHHNVPSACMGVLTTNPIRVGEGLHVAGDLGLTTTTIQEIELLEDGGIQIKTRNSTYIIYDQDNMPENKKPRLGDLNDFT